MRQWTDAQRQRQSEIIKNWQPWKNSTGAKTAKGKEKSSKNSFKNRGRLYNQAKSLIASNNILDRNKISEDLIQTKIIQMKIKRLLKEIK
jgi:hypothetical protein